ncbi:uncharacterized protein LOC105427306 [Pogonomyrmex barbatus]|uniref:Uncharacterized protein LOC105427306 n=1 Tax=Pogonomyrmex barbatus TaxID=144034 RepID=A0A6I9W9N5_9HYME|nr:uncharacterized protein LOC105427306 [Pogonomyrmex barbatus]
MSEPLNIKNVTKFDGTNFTLWKFQNAIFTVHELKKIVDGTKTEPRRTDSTWSKENAKAVFIILSTMEYSQLAYLITCNSAAQMWTKLIHEQKTASNKLMLMQKFHEYCMTTNDSVSQHVAKIENMARQFKDFGGQVSDVAIMAKVLGSLPTKYNALITAWDSVDPAQQTLNSLLEHLLKEEARLIANDDVASALAAMSLNFKQNPAC